MDVYTFLVSFLVSFFGAFYAYFRPTVNRLDRFLRHLEYGIMLPLVSAVRRLFEKSFWFATWYIWIGIFVCSILDMHSVKMSVGNLLSVDNSNYTQSQVCLASTCVPEYYRYTFTNFVFYVAVSSYIYMYVNIFVSTLFARNNYLTNIILLAKVCSWYITGLTISFVLYDITLIYLITYSIFVIRWTLPWSDRLLARFVYTCIFVFFTDMRIADLVCYRNQLYYRFLDPHCMEQMSAKAPYAVSSLSRDSPQEHYKFHVRGRGKRTRLRKCECKYDKRRCVAVDGAVSSHFMSLKAFTKQYGKETNFIIAMLTLLYDVKYKELSTGEIFTRLIPIIGVERIADVSEQILQFLEDFPQPRVPVEPIAVDGNLFDKAGKFLKDTKEAPIFAKGSRFFFGVMAIPVLDLCGFTYSKSSMSKFVKMKALKTQFDDPVKALESMLEFMSALVDVGSQCFANRSFGQIFTPQNDVSDFMKKFEDIEKRLRDQYVDENYSASTMYEEMRALEKEGRALLKKEFSFLIQSSLKTLSLKMVAVARAASHASMRKPPFAILYYSPPGQGKSSLVKNSYEFYWSIVTGILGHILDYDPEVNIYTQNPLDEFQSGYNGAIHWGFTLDDLAFETKELLKATGGVTLKTLIFVLNVIGFASNQAELEKKGVVPFCPRMVVATTNTKDLNAVFAANEPLALIRRLPIVVTPHVKPECRKDGKLDIQKIVSEDGVITYQEYDDPWTFDVDVIEYDPEDQTPQGTRWWYKRIMTNAPAATYWKWIGEQIVEHEKKAEKTKEGFRQDPLNSVCKKHATMKRFCPCRDQEDETPIGEPFAASGSVQEPIYDRTVGKILNVWPLNVATENTVQVVNGVLYRLCVRSCPTVAQKALGIVDHFAPYTARNVFRRLVDRERPEVYRNLKRVVECLYGIGAVAFVSFAMYHMNKPKKEPVPEAAAGIWSTDEDHFMVNGTVQKGAEPIIETLRASLVGIKVTRDGWSGFVSGLNLGNGNILTVAHVFGTHDWWDIAMYYGIDKNINSAQGSRIERHQVTFLPNDKAIIHTRWAVPRRDIRPFIQEPWKPNGRCKVIGFNHEHQIIEVNDGIIRSSTRASYKREAKCNDDTIYHVNDVLVADYSRPIVAGDCGSIVLVEHRKGWIIHSMICCNMGLPNLGGSTVLRPDECNPPPLFSYAAGLEIPVRGNSKLGEMGPRSDKFKHQWAGPIFGEMMGSYPTVARPRSHVVETPIADKIYGAFPNMNHYGAPIMHKVFKPDGSFFDPEVVSIQQSGRPAFKMVESKMKRAADSLIKKFIKDPNIKNIRPCTIDEAINGIAGNDFANRLVMGTSGGIYKSGPKRVNFNIDAKGNYTMDPELKAAVDEAFAKYERGERCYFPFKGSLKDEPVKKGKFKTRVFTAASLPFTIVERQQLLLFAEWMMRNNLVSECAAGMNCYGPEWEKLYNHMTFGKTLFDKAGDGDYAHFDKDMIALAIELAMYVITSVCEATGNYSQKDLTIQRGIKTDLAYPVVVHHGDAMMHYCGHVSGHALTVIINSIVNSLYMRVVWMDITGLDPEEFDEYVRLMTLGDDNLWNSKHPNFNHRAIATAMEALGLTYTMADKEAESVPFRNIRETTFLKRSFRNLEGKIVAPLELESTLKGFTCFEERGNVTWPEQLAQVYLAALREWSLHGPEIFVMMKTKVKPIIDSVDGVEIFLHPRCKYEWKQMFDWVTTGEDDYVEEQPEYPNAFAVSGLVRTVSNWFESTETKCKRALKLRFFLDDDSVDILYRDASILGGNKVSELITTVIRRWNTIIPGNIDHTNPDYQDFHVRIIVARMISVGIYMRTSNEYLHFLNDEECRVTNRLLDYTDSADVNEIYTYMWFARRLLDEFGDFEEFQRAISYYESELTHIPNNSFIAPDVDAVHTFRNCGVVFSGLGGRLVNCWNYLDGVVTYDELVQRYPDRPEPNSEASVEVNARDGRQGYGELDAIRGVYAQWADEVEEGIESMPSLISTERTDHIDFEVFIDDTYQPWYEYNMDDDTILYYFYACWKFRWVPTESGFFNFELPLSDRNQTYMPTEQRDGWSVFFGAQRAEIEAELAHAMANNDPKLIPILKAFLEQDDAQDVPHVRLVAYANEPDHSIWVDDIHEEISATLE